MNDFNASAVELSHPIEPSRFISLGSTMMIQNMQIKNRRYYRISVNNIVNFIRMVFLQKMAFSYVVVANPTLALQL